MIMLTQSASKMHLSYLGKPVRGISLKVHISRIGSPLLAVFQSYQDVYCQSDYPRELPVLHYPTARCTMGSAPCIWIDLLPFVSPEM
jgi:hypothetical protein